MLKWPFALERPTSGQFAIDGAWESAWAFTTDTLPDAAAIRRWVAGRREVAFEAFLGDSFFGVRREGPRDEVERFAVQCVQALRAVASGHGIHFVDALSQALGLTGFCGMPAFAEVGAVNAWRSVGAFRIERPHEAARDLDALWTALMAAPVARADGHRKALEIASAAPLPHWLGLPVCEARPPFALSLERLRTALEPLRIAPA